jgi:hypothetical protein
VFIEQAAKEAEEAPIIEGDERAGELLQEARRQIYHWPEDFSGFQCQLVYQEGPQGFTGSLATHGSRKIQIELPELSDARWLRFQVEELIAHREAPSVSRMASKSGCSWGDWDETYGRRIDFLGDKMSSFYRIKDKKLTQIGRSYKNQDFIINIDSHQLCHGSFVANYYTAYYWAQDDQKLSKVETYLDEYEEIGDVFLPVRRHVTEAVDGNLKCRTLIFGNIQLNNNGGSK